MLVIGHRGARGLAPENTLQSLQAGVDAGADMLEFDVRLTADNVPILSHDAQQHGLNIRRNSFDELKNLGPVTTLRSVLDEFYGSIPLNLEYKPGYGTDVVYDMLRCDYIEQPEDWKNLLISSFSLRALSGFRRRSQDADLALLHDPNPLVFAYNNWLRLAAVGWNYRRAPTQLIDKAKRLGMFTYVYTVNDPREANELEKRGIEGICTDYPDRFATPPLDS